MKRAFLYLLFVTFAQSAVQSAEHRFWLVAQHDWGGKKGFYFNVENSSEGADSTSPTAPCRLASLRLILGVADGKEWRYLVATPQWEFDKDYTTKAVIEPRAAALWLDGQRVAQAEGGFIPSEGGALCNHVPGWASGAAEYIVRQSSLTMSGNGGKRQVVSFADAMARPLSLLLFEPQAARSVGWKANPQETLTIETTFRLVRYPDLRSLAPFIDRYGQSRHAEWQGKVKSDEDLRRAAEDEDRRLAEWKPSKDYDRFGGYALAGWKEKATGFFRVVRRGSKWWLISPEGNPCFYVGLCSTPALNWEQTPVTEREFLYEWLPPQQPPWSAARGRNLWGINDGTEYVAFHTANLIRKYGEGWEQKAGEAATRRLKAWAFSGGGKWGGVLGLPVTPVLGRWDVPNLARHPDVFDPQVCAAFRESLRKQIEPRKNDPMVLGWSLGNEYDEIITREEIVDILRKPANVPGKRALIEFALRDLYGSDLKKLSQAWGIAADDLYAAQPRLPAGDVDRLRRYYADRYYAFVYRTVKELDPNHLYLGFWIVPGWWENEEDWRLGAKHCDVIGYDRYAPEFTDDRLLRLMRESDKPALCGEFSFPSWYDGTRGFGLYGTWAKDDADAGDLYARWVETAARNPYCVGVLWFQYRDQPLTGRGPGRGSGLVIGEHYAFGMVDITDRPKWDLVEHVRRTNLNAVKWRLGH